MITTPQGYYEQGYKDGQRLYSESQTYQPSDLRRIANKEIAEADKKQDTAIPMTMQVHYRDGVIAGYGPKKQEGEKSSTA